MFVWSLKAILEAYDRHAPNISKALKNGEKVYFEPEEEKFLTKELLQATCMIGTQDDLIDQLRALNDAGLNQVMNLPSFDPRFEVLASIAEKIIPNV